MSDNKNVDNPLEKGRSKIPDPNIAVSCGETSSVAGSVKTTKTHPRVSSSSERQIKFERAQKCLENAALVSKRIKEHRKATAELLGRPFEDDDVADTASELASTLSERTGYSAATDTSTTLSVQDALNIPGISESLANTLKQKELLMERIKQYKEISKRPIKTSTVSRKETVTESDIDLRKSKDNSDVTQLVNTIKEKENALTVMQVRMKAMETTILDLQEKINEKDQIIEAKNKATSLMSDSLSKKEKDSLHLLEDTRQQMIKMQENFINMEAEWKEERERLVKQIEEKDEKISNLEEANTILENSRFEISIAHSKLVEELDLKNTEIAELEKRIQQLSQVEIVELTQKEKDDVEEEKGSLEIANMVELTKKIELLEQLNCQIRQTNKELENKLATINPDPKPSASGSPSKKGSPLPTRKTGRNTASKMKSPWSNLSTETLNQEPDKKPNKNEIAKLEMLVQSLNKDILDKEYLISQKDSLIAELQHTNVLNETTINELKSCVRTDFVDIGVCTETRELVELVHNIEKTKDVEVVQEKVEPHLVDTEDLHQKLGAAQEQIAALNEEIEIANKNMIKVKSNHKLKLKQMQKTIDNFSKVSDVNAEIVRLNEELHQLSQKVAELEEEKGNLQLHLVDYDSGRLTETDIYKKMVEMENLAEARLKSISVLEAQKFDLVQELHELQQKNVEMEDRLADMSQFQTEQVSSEIKSAQLEEQIDELFAAKKELELVVQNLKLDKEQLEGTIKLSEEEKEELIHKLEHYIQENMELTDKLEKLSAEKVSSAESIEIVESLTTQEKLELEEYNKGMIENTIDNNQAVIPVSRESGESIEKLMDQSAELNRKIELFTQERQEVMEKMSKISSENEILHDKISELTNQCSSLQDKINLLSKEKDEISTLNKDLTCQIEELKRERIEIMKESMEIPKPISVDEAEGTADMQQDDKTVADKSNKGTKSVKQLTKEILKLKNTIKEREAEIGDCQMKILSLEEQQQKYNELIQSNSSNESKIKSLLDENHQLKEELENAKANKESEQNLIQMKQANDFLQQEMRKLHQEYTFTINTRDARIHELENLLVEYEKQISNYGNILQQKDKEMAEYINQITKLNDVSQKLKSTIEVLEEEKAKDQNAELVKSLNKQISAYQKKLSECEEKLHILDEEKSQLLSLKGALENKNLNLETELKNMQESFAEKQNLIKDMQIQQQKHADEMSNVILQVKERDEEIHEIKLQLRKESIENEKLRTTLSEKENNAEEFTQELEETKEKLNNLSNENVQLREQYTAIETKNKELMDKLKKFAVSIKKKSSMYADLESQMNETQKQLESRDEYLEQLKIQVETLPALQDKLKHAEEELTRLQYLKVTIEQQKSNDIQYLQAEIKTLQEKLTLATENVKNLNEAQILLQKESEFMRDENKDLKLQIDNLNNKLADQEIEQKNNMNLITKINSLEADINQKQMQIVELLNKLETHEQQLNQLQYGHDAKLQERDLFIESLETEINKYKNRICRLEESISIMEDRRHSLERKADQLGSQLQEKQKAYSEYTSQEDQLVSRLAVLMDHDRVVEKQLYEIENENKELQYKIQHFNEENQRLRKSLSDIQEYCNTLVEKASKADLAESEVAKYQTQLHELETQLKRITHEHQTLIVQKKQDIDELESEFHTQIENAIKEKKTLSEKYEKLSERVILLENKLQEYNKNIENLNINNEELTRINQELNTKLSNKEQVQMLDYTEQYINEINKLNSIVNSKTQEISELNNRIQSLKTNNLTNISNLESKTTELNTQLQSYSTEIDHLVQELNSLKLSNEQLQTMLNQKDEQIKKLIEKKTVTFEMNIPKTEGMIISSTIEPLNEGHKDINVAFLESQILSESEIEYAARKTPEKMQTQSAHRDASLKAEVEEVIVPKKAYLCYKSEEDISQEASDPFNSDEGWGLGESEDIGEVTPGLSHLNEQIQKLKKDNEALKADLQTSNTKLVKALKKLKELKSSNDRLLSELKISKQMPQSSFLDSAIEDEMKNNIKVLEEKIEQLTTDLNKEKRDKETLKKQNDIFNNANDRLTEMKEKLENDLELWKYKFKEANDKISTLQWGGESKDSPDHNAAVSSPQKPDSALKNEIAKLERENDELQSMVDQLTSQNNDLLSKQASLTKQVTDLNNQLNQSQTTVQNHETLTKQLLELQNNNAELLNSNKALIKQKSDVEGQYQDIKQRYEQMNVENEDIHNSLKVQNKQLIENNFKLEDEIRSLRQYESKYNNLMAELETTKSKLIWHEQQQSVPNTHNLDILTMTEKCSTMEEYCSQLKKTSDSANDRILQLESEKQELLQKVNNFEVQKSVPMAHNVDILAMNEKYSAMEDYCSQLKLTIDVANDRILQLEGENNELLQKVNNYEEQLKELQSKIVNLNAENDQLLSTVAELRSSVSSAVDQRGFEIAELWKQHLAQREADFQKTEHELRTLLNASEAKYEQLLDNVQSSTQEETNHLVMMEQVTSLQSKLQDKEEHLRNLQDKYAEAVSQLDVLRSEIEDEKIMLENKLLSQQEEFEKQIQDLSDKNKQHAEGYEQSYKNLQTELAATKTYNEEMNTQVQELLAKVEEFERNIQDLTNQLRMKDNELHQRTHDYGVTLAQRNEEFENVRKQLLDYEKKIEELNYEKEAELAVLRLKMHENGDLNDKLQNEMEAEKTSLTEALNEKIIECTNLNRQISELNKTLKEHSINYTEMQIALENQELEIVTLKDEIANLTDALRSSSSKIEKHVTFATDTKPGTDGEKPESMINKELLDPVPRAELDLALYMLHQRDVRCEELTMELTQLLEERDTLQLRLSDSLRSYEELKSSCKSAGLDLPMNLSQESISELPTYTVEKEQQFVDVHKGQTSRSSSISEHDGDKPKLQAKLSELRTVKHSRDVRLRQDSEQRQLDYRLLQRDVANLPPEAVEQLAQAHHTLSRDSQSTSTVLLNWLRGKSTPKVVHM